MSGLFGGGHSQSASPIRYNGIQISSSSSGNCLPLAYGRVRLPFNLMWYGAFSSTPNNTSSGGKGGHGTQTTSYTYRSSFAAGICEGSVSNIYNVFNDKDLTTLAALGMTIFYGTSAQSTWSYLTTNFPTQAIPYDHVCYVGAQNYLLGSSAALPNITFEVQAFLGLTGTTINFTAGLGANATSATMTSAYLANGIWNITFSDFEVRQCTVSSTSVQWTTPLVNAVTSVAVAGGVYDADPAAMLLDYLTDPNHGVGFPSAKVATLTGANSYSSYCQSLGLTLSPSETTQRAAADFIKEVLHITNSDAVWSAGTLKIIPYADAAVSGNGFSYTPNLTPLYIFTDDDFTEPPTVTRVATADTYNHVRVEYINRSNSYNTDVVEVTDISDIAETGERVMDTLSFHEITNSAAANMAGRLILQTSLYERNTIKFKVRPDYSLLEPMDYIGICDPVKADGSGLGYGTVNTLGQETSSQVFRVTKVTDDEKGSLEIEAMEVPGTVRTAAAYDWTAVQGYNANFAASPGNVDAPAFMEAYGVLVNPAGGRQLFIAVCGATTNAAWGGCNVFMSFDGTTYDQIGIVSSPCRYGTLSANMAYSAAIPDTTSTASVTLANTTLVLGTGSAADAQENRLLMAVGSSTTLEVISYETATLVSAGNYNITTMYRGLYGTTGQTHSSGAQFMRLDGNIVRMDIDPGWMGQTVYFKFCSFNTYGRATQDISTATAYTYTFGQSISAYNSVSTAGLGASGQCVIYSPTSGAKMTTGANAFDSSIYSLQSFTNGCTATCSPSQGSSYTGSGLDHFMFGLTVNPLASNSYTNLAYAWHFADTGNVNGVLQIYEGGSFIGSYGTYVNTDIFEIVYDGKHVVYYQNAVPVRSVPISNQTFFMQASIAYPGISLYGLDFNNISSAPQPFTLSPMTANVAAYGTRAVGNSQYVTNNWGYRNFKSLESFSNGVRLSFNVTVASSYVFLGLSTSPTVTAGTQGPVLAAWYPAGPSAESVVLFNSTNVFVHSGTPALTDVFTLIYDNFNFYWYLNQTLIYQQYFPNAGQLYLFGDMYESNAGIQNIAFEPYGQATPVLFAARGNGVVADASYGKPLGATVGWTTGDAYSINGFAQCHMVGKINQLLNAFLGITTNQVASAISDLNISYAFDFGNAGNWTIYELGSPTATVGGYAVGDYFAVTYDGTNVVYYQNQVAVRTTAVGSISIMIGQVNVYDAGAVLVGLDFGTGALVPVQDTGQINTNAVSQIISNFSATAVVCNVSVSAGTLQFTIITAPTIVTTGFPVAIDAMANVSYTIPNFSNAGVALISVYRDGTIIASSQFNAQPLMGGNTSGLYPLTLSLTDAPAAGSHVYTLHFTASNGGSSGSYSTTFTNNFIKVREVKK